VGDDDTLRFARAPGRKDDVHGRCCGHLRERFVLKVGAMVEIVLRNRQNLTPSTYPSSELALEHRGYDKLSVCLLNDRLESGFWLTGISQGERRACFHDAEQRHDCPHGLFEA